MEVMELIEAGEGLRGWMGGISVSSVLLNGYKYIFIIFII